MNKRLVVLVVLLLLPVLVLSTFRAPGLSLNSASAAGTVLDAVEETLGQIYEQVNPSVVNIQVVQTAGALSQDHPEVPGFPDIPSTPEMPFQAQGQGSGFVWDEEGHIVTNNHVVAGADRITVVFYDGLSASAEVVGTDPNSDLAVVKVDVPAGRLQPVEVADSTQVRVGQLAVAIGNPFGLDGTMTVGFVSALGRSLPVQSGAMLQASYTIPDIVQTDAPINPGNSGGVLVDDEGRVIGVPTAIESPVGANAGIGFAVPSTIVQKVVPALIRDGSYEHPWLGISGTSLTSNLAEAMALDADERGVLVIDVVEGGPASQASLQGSQEEVDVDGLSTRAGGDVIVAIDGQPIDEFEDLVTHLARYTSVGQTVELTILREGREEAVEVTLAARPEEEAQVVPQVVPDTVPTGGAWLGIQGQTVTLAIAEAMELPNDQQGVLVQEVIGDTPADEAGLLGSNQIVDINGQQVAVGGDIIVALDGQPIDGFEDLRAELAQAEPGQRVELGLLREGTETAVSVTLGERPTIMP